MKGVCLRIMGSPLHAEECLKTVVSMEKKIKEDRFLVPYAHVELAFLYKTKGNLDKAAHYLEIAKYILIVLSSTTKKYKKYRNYYLTSSIIFVHLKDSLLLNYYFEM